MVNAKQRSALRAMGIDPTGLTPDEVATLLAAPTVQEVVSTEGATTEVVADEVQVPEVVAEVVQEVVVAPEVQLPDPLAEFALPAHIVVPTRATSAGVVIEPNRPVQNGVKQPSVGTKCRAVWDWCATATAANGGIVPPVKVAKAYGVSMGWNDNNTSIEYYNWRKFMGLRARG